jgi:hypothetical protein
MDKKIFRAAPQRILVKQDERDDSGFMVQVERSYDNMLNSGIVVECGELFPELFGVPPLTLPRMLAYILWRRLVGKVIRRNFDFKPGTRVWYARGESAKIEHDGSQLVALHWKDVVATEY